MSTGIIVCRVFFARYELLWVEQLTIGPSSHFIDNSRFEIDEYGTGNMLASSSLREKGIEGIIASTYVYIKAQKLKT